MLNNKGNVMVIDDPVLLLESIHKGFFTDSVDHTRYAIGVFVYLVDRALAEELSILVSCVIQMGTDVSFRFRTVQMREDAVNIDPLSYSGIPLQPELVIPQFCLSDKDQSHGALGIKFKIEQETEFFYGFSFKEMCLIQYAYYFFMLYPMDDLYFLMKLFFCFTKAEL